MKEVKQFDNAEEILKLPNSWEERGIRKGMEKGIEKGKRDVALNMLKKGFSVELIMAATELERAKVEQLKERI